MVLRHFVPQEKAYKYVAVTDILFIAKKSHGDHGICKPNALGHGWVSQIKKLAHVYSFDFLVFIENQNLELAAIQIRKIEKVAIIILFDVLGFDVFTFNLDLKFMIFQVVCFKIIASYKVQLVIFIGHHNSLLWIIGN